MTSVETVKAGNTSKRLIKRNLDDSAGNWLCMFRRIRRWCDHLLKKINLNIDTVLRSSGICNQLHLSIGTNIPVTAISETLGNLTSGLVCAVAMVCSHGWTRTHSTFAGPQHLPYCFTLDSRCDIPRRKYELHAIGTAVMMRKIAAAAL